MQIEQFQPSIQASPTQFYDDVLGCTYWEKQKAITEALFKHQRVTVKSCNGSGKSYIAARAALAFLFAYPDSVVITTAPTWRQVEDIIWRELRTAYQAAKVPLGGTLLKTRFEIDNKWYAKGMSSDQPDNFQGYHAPYILFIIDEPTGIPRDSFDAIDGNLSSENVRELLIGNPTRGDGFFYDSFKSQFFHKITISAFDTPNFTTNNIKSIADLRKFKTAEDFQKLKILYPHLITPRWAWEKLHDWGEDSPVFQARIGAQFPEEGEDTLIGLHLVEQAVEKQFTEEDKKFWPTCNVIGIDVARFGSDQTVFTVMDNLDMIDLDWHSGKDTMKTCGKAVNLFKEYGFSKEHDLFVVDDTGLGGGVTDRLVELGYTVIPVNFGAASEDTEEFANLKAEIFWCLRRVFKDGDISIQDKGKLVGQIPTIRYDFTSSGKISIIKKKDMKKAGLTSPDFADSLALAVWGVHLHTAAGQDIDPSVGKGGTVAGGLQHKKF